MLSQTLQNPLNHGEATGRANREEMRTQRGQRGEGDDALLSSESRGIARRAEGNGGGCGRQWQGDMHVSVSGGSDGGGRDNQLDPGGHKQEPEGN